jgi:alanine racemase
MNNENNYNIINIKNIKENINLIKDKYDQYEYYMAVVKANCYGFGYEEICKRIENQVSYFVVTTLDEAINLRNLTKKPILCLGIINNENLDICKKNNITITIPNYEYLKNIDPNELKNIKVHIKINTGMNRLGIKTEIEFNNTYNYLISNNINIEGIYTHIYNASNKTKSNNQIKKFEEITKNINLKKIKIVHLFASDATKNIKKPVYANGIRMGINMYGLGEENLLSCFQVKSKITQINKLNQGETLGYNGTFKANNTTKIAVIPLGYYNGITRNYKGMYVYINNKKYEIVGNVCMNMMFIKIDDFVKVGDSVYVIKDNNHIRDIAQHTDTITYEITCNIDNKIPKEYII